MIIDDGVNLPGLVVPKTSYVADPWLANAVEIEYGVVDLHHPTRDPNRTTIHVPSESTVLSLGQGSGQWKTDTGITGYTDNHIHFETKVAGDGVGKTIVSLGGPATTAEINGLDAKVPTKSVGYSMVTAERAWHESAGQHYLLSHEEDISMRAVAGGKRAVVQAKLGYVDINGGEEVSVTGGGVAIGAASQITMHEVAYDENFTGKSPTSASAKTAKNVADSISILYSAHDLILKATKMVKKGKPTNAAETEYFFADIAKWGGDAVKFYISANKLKKALTQPSSTAGSVKLAAEKDVGALAGKDIALSGFLGASMGSTGSASIAAGLIATLKGTVFAGVSSILTGIKAQKKLEVTSTYGDVVFSAKKNLEFTSVGDFVAGSKGDAQITGAKQVLFGGGTRAFIGAKGGWGALFDDKGVAFGKVAGADNRKSATIEPKPAIRIDNDKIELASGEAKVTFGNDEITIAAPGVRVDSKRQNVTMNGQRVVLAK